jgi:hypothetical protein
MVQYDDDAGVQHSVNTGRVAAAPAADSEFKCVQPSEIKCKLDVPYSMRDSRAQYLAGSSHWPTFLKLLQ